MQRQAGERLWELVGGAAGTAMKALGIVAHFQPCWDALDDSLTSLPCSCAQMNLEDNCEDGPDGNCKIVVS